MAITSPDRTRVKFNGEQYRDDRMYVLYICKGTETIVGDRVSTTIYHEESPVNAKWCLVTYRNNSRYMAVRSNFFDSKQDAETDMKRVEPMVPLISLGGLSWNPPLPYEEFLRWKKENGFQEYDYKKMFLPDSKNPTETMLGHVKGPKPPTHDSG